MPTFASAARKAVNNGDSRYDRRLAMILEHATEVFCDKGYAEASMRDLSRASGMSLAGLYYYFQSKEKLLHLVQRHTFETILERLRPQLEGVSDPEQRIRIFIRNHLGYFLANQKGMKVLSHEGGVLRDELGESIRAIKRRYYQLCRGLVDELKQERGLEFPTRLAVLSLFGMMNWIYTWHNPKIDGDAAQLAQGMADMFLQGLTGAGALRVDVMAFHPTERSGARGRQKRKPAAGKRRGAASKKSKT